MSTKSTDIRITDVRIGCDDFAYRTPIKFGGVAVDQATILNVECEVVTRDGKVARGFGSMPLANIWAYPSRTMSCEQTLAAMRTLADRCAKIFGEHTGMDQQRGLDALRVSARQHLQFGKELRKQSGGVSGRAEHIANLRLGQRRLRERAQVQPDHGTPHPGLCLDDLGGFHAWRL